jgi:hypothetical protein
MNVVLPTWTSSTDSASPEMGGAPKQREMIVEGRQAGVTQMQPLVARPCGSHYLVRPAQTQAKTVRFSEFSSDGGP